MPEPLTVTPAELIAAALAARGAATALGHAVLVAGDTIRQSFLPATGWLASADTRHVATLAVDRLDAIGLRLAAVSTALAAAAAAYEGTDNRAAQRFRFTAW